MTRLDGPIIPNQPYVYCKADLEQKKIHHVDGTDIDLYIENKFNENLRERNPNYATVIYVPNVTHFTGYDKKQYPQILQPGDLVCLQHFQLQGHSNESLEEIEDVDGMPLFRVDLKEVYFKINEGKPELLSDYTLCEYETAKTITDAGVILPETAIDPYRRSSKRAIVVQVSESVENINEGDVIYYSDFADYELEFDGKKLLKISAGDILAKVINSIEL